MSWRQRFRRTLRTKDWAAFLTYAPSVRYLGEPRFPSGSPFVPPEFFEAVCALRPQHTLLPNVVELAADSLALRHWVIPHLLTILGKGLQVASIYWTHTSEDGEPSGTVAATLDILSDFHRLQQLTLDGDPGLDDEPPAAPFRYLGTRPQLTKFECCNIPLLMEGIAYLANLPSLRTVHICLPDALSWPSHSLSDKPFSMTESSSLHSTVESYIAFAQRIALSCVQSFSIFLTAPQLFSRCSLYLSAYNSILQCPPVSTSGQELGHWILWQWQKTPSTTESSYPPITSDLSSTSPSFVTSPLCSHGGSHLTTLSVMTWRRRDLTSRSFASLTRAGASMPRSRRPCVLCRISPRTAPNCATSASNSTQCHGRMGYLNYH